MRTAQEIKDEINRLKDLKPKIRHYSAFGGSNRDKVQAQIDALEEEWDEEDVYDKEDEGELSADEGSNARNAIEWREGETEELPSDNWKHLIGK